MDARMVVEEQRTERVLLMDSNKKKDGDNSITRKFSRKVRKWIMKQWNIKKE